MKHNKIAVFLLALLVSAVTFAQGASDNFSETGKQNKEKVWLFLRPRLVL